MFTINPKAAATVAAMGVLALPMGAAQAADAAKERAEVRSMCDEALATLYKAKPGAKEQIAKSAGYGCFSSFGVSLLVGGAGGKGLVHNTATKKDTYMNMGQVSAGLDISIKDYREVLVFKDRQTLEAFVDKGWELTGSGGASAGVEGKGGTAEKGGNVSDKIDIYPMTKTGLSAGGAAAGRKYWKDADLNPK
ncbi:YSC84-related protein [Uliginosibacterium sp. H1]|uniref:lipid-binding SYLF domain-containing protein n=1 Tax=Uliginosibacterium sp. H1 TaxID=3114757 RepID=UPI002E17D28F|nr:YSC84-related protein [Uliginosibacterium sp. H1]